MAKSDQEIKWQAEDDARTVIKVSEIFSDPARRKRAMSEFKKQRAAVAGAEQLLAKRLIGR